MLCICVRNSSDNSILDTFAGNRETFGEKNIQHYIFGKPVCILASASSVPELIKSIKCIFVLLLYVKKSNRVTSGLIAVHLSLKWLQVIIMLILRALVVLLIKLRMKWILVMPYNYFVIKMMASDLLETELLPCRAG